MPPTPRLHNPCRRANRLLALASATLALVLVGTAAGGCRGGRKSGRGTAGTNGTPGLRPIDASVGRVIQVNEQLRFAVLDYTLSRMPPPGTRLVLYRSTNRVGVVRLSGWRNVATVAADFVDGVPLPGDLARPE
jgi:hypothetical protein